MNEGAREEAAARWLPFVRAFVEAYALGERLTTGGPPPPPTDSGVVSCPLPPNRGGGKCPLVLLCSPHPDDEVLTGALPLRLLREQGARVVNLAITLGSDSGRQLARWAEVTAACGVLGFACRRLQPPHGFALKDGPEDKGWMAAVQGVVELFEELGPDLVFLPHGEDQHPAHVATSHLVAEALTRFSTGRGNSLLAVETEYWRPMAAPNLLVGVSPEDLALMLAALICHRGEILRNPYHLTQPARLMDTVRRGAELVNSLGGRPPFLFGELYRVSEWRQGRGEALRFDHGWLAPGEGLWSIMQKSSIKNQNLFYRDL